MFTISWVFLDGEKTIHCWSLIHNNTRLQNVLWTIWQLTLIFIKQIIFSTIYEWMTKQNCGIWVYNISCKRRYLRFIFLWERHWVSDLRIRSSYIEPNNIAGEKWDFVSIYAKFKSLYIEKVTVLCWLWAGIVIYSYFFKYGVDLFIIGHWIGRQRHVVPMWKFCNNYLRINLLRY